MIERDRDIGFVASCDHCSHTDELSADSFQEAVDEIKEDGWLITKPSGQWDHMCPSCREDQD